MYNLSLDKLYY